MRICFLGILKLILLCLLHPYYVEVRKFKGSVTRHKEDQQRTEAQGWDCDPPPRLDQKRVTLQTHLLPSNIRLPDQVTLSAEIENLGRSVGYSPPGESGAEAARGRSWVSGEEFDMYVETGAQGWLAVTSSFESLSIIPNPLCWSSGSFCSPVILSVSLSLSFLVPIRTNVIVLSLIQYPCAHPDDHFCFLGLSQILLRLARRVVKLQHVLEGVVSQVDAVGSKLKMLERKGGLAPPHPGVVSALQLGLLSSLQLESILFLHS